MVKKESRIKLSEERRAALISNIGAMYQEEFDEDLSSFRAEQLLDHFIKLLGPAVYNQAIQDARAFMAQQLDDLDATFHE